MRKFLQKFFLSAWFYNALLLINIYGTLYGFYWYAGQFSATPLYFWPFVANSPLAVLYIFIVIALLKLGRRSVFLEGMAYFGLIKHGLWTVFIVTVYQLQGNIYPENYLLLSGHAAMALQGILFWHYFGLPLSFPQAAAISAWYIFNDYLDYVVGIYPRVDLTVVSFATIRNMALTYTAVLTILYFLSALKTYKKKKKNPAA